MLTSACTSTPPAISPVASASEEPTAIAPAVWSRLQIPLHLPTLAAGQSCPRSTGRVVTTGVVAALGDGPVYAAGFGTDGLAAVVAHPAGNEAKVLWVASPVYAGPVLIRGGRLDGQGWVAFSVSTDLNATPTPELRLGQPTAIGDTPAGWREWPSETYVSSAGCYAFQVDGLGFTQVLVFQAAL